MNRTTFADENQAPQSDVFSFIVGTQKEVFKIHSGLIQDLSKPLHSLVNNKFFKESQERQGYLPEEDTEVFALFMEWAYIRSYRVGRNERAMSEDTSIEAVAKSSLKKMPYGSLDKFYCAQCDLRKFARDTVENGLSTFPICKECSGIHRCVACRTKMKQVENASYACKECSQRYGIGPVDHCATSSHRFALFRNREYPAADANHISVRNFLDTGISVVEVSPKLLIHAQLFIFADKWLISALKELALHRLHREICEYQIGRDEGAELVRLFRCCFANESESEPNNGAFPELKELVCAYASCKSEELLQCKQFRELIQQSGEIALQFIDAVNRRFS